MMRKGRFDSFLFVPAKENLLKNINKYKSDYYIIDLEDSIQFNDKLNALKLAENWLKDNKDRNDILVRVNKDRYKYEIKALKKYNVGFVLPKFESKQDYRWGRKILFGRNVLALIESPKAMVNIGEIVGCDYVSGIAFGAEDYSVIVNRDNRYTHFSYEKNKLIIYAKAAKKKVIDTPCFDILNKEDVTADIRNSYDLGFDGKFCIHPSQVNIISNLARENNIEYLREIVEKYDSEDAAVICIDGKVYEKMHIDEMREILKDK